MGTSSLVDDWHDSMPKIQNPPTRAQKKKFFGKSLIGEFKSQFQKKVWRSPLYATASFYVLLGQLPHIRNMRIKIGNNFEDCRLHLMLIQESGSGKGGGFSFVGDIAEKLGMHFRTTGELTGAALVGWRDNRDGEIVLEPGILDPRYPDPEDPNPVNIVASSEGSQLLDVGSRDYSSSAINHLQKAMNRMGTKDNIVERQSGIGRPVSFNSSVSMFLTSYKPPNLFQTITQTGLLQRMMVIYNTISLEDKMKVGKTSLKLLEEDYDEELEISDIVRALRIIDDHYRRKDKNRLGITKKAKRALAKYVVPEMYHMISGLEPNVMHEVKKFTTRYQVMLYKFAWHHAMSRLSDTVEQKDIAYALSFLQLKPIVFLLSITICMLFLIPLFLLSLSFYHHP